MNTPFRAACIVRHEHGGRCSQREFDWRRRAIQRLPPDVFDARWQRTPEAKKRRRPKPWDDFDNGIEGAFDDLPDGMDPIPWENGEFYK